MKFYNDFPFPWQVHCRPAAFEAVAHGFKITIEGLLEEVKPIGDDRVKVLGRCSPMSFEAAMGYDGT